VHKIFRLNMTYYSSRSQCWKRKVWKRTNNYLI